MKRTIELLAALSLLQFLFVYFAPAQRFANSGDDYAYLFQARLFASGQLYAQDPIFDRSHPLNRYVATLCLTDFQGRRFSKYPPGWSILLAAGTTLGVEWLVS